MSCYDFQTYKHYGCGCDRAIAYALIKILFHLLINSVKSKT